MILRVVDTCLHLKHNIIVPVTCSSSELLALHDTIGPQEIFDLLQHTFGKFTAIDPE